MVKLGECEEEAVWGTTAMLFKRVISSIPRVKRKVAVCTGDAIRSVFSRVVEPSCCCELLYRGKASRGVERPDITKRLLTRRDHLLADRVFFRPSRVPETKANGSYDREATARRVCEMFVRGNIGLLPAI